MKLLSRTLRTALLTGVAASLALQPLPSLRADDHGNGSESGHHGEGGDDHGGGGGNGGGGIDDHGNGGGQNGEDRGKTEFLGTVEALPATTGFVGTWTVSGRAVIVDASTFLRTERHGAPVVGGRVEVEGALLADGSTVRASAVKTEDTGREFEDNVFFGPIQALPAAGLVGTWRVGGLTVVVNAATRVEAESAAPAVGLLARVEGVQQANGSFVASEVNVQAPGAPLAVPTDKIKISGRIQLLPGTPGQRGNWIINDVVVTVSDDSLHVEGGRKPKVGRKATIKGRGQINGSVRATKVNVPAAVPTAP